MVTDPLNVLNAPFALNASTGHKGKGLQSCLCEAQERGRTPVTFQVTILCFFCFVYVKTTTRVHALCASSKAYPLHARGTPNPLGYHGRAFFFALFLVIRTSMNWPLYAMLFSYAEPWTKKILKG